jgi:diguanylate cyclase (GGDEF)-like protein
MTTGMPIQEAVHCQAERDQAAEQAITSAPLPFVLRLCNVVMGLAALAAIAMAYGVQEYGLAFLITGASFAVLGVLGFVSAAVSRRRLTESQARFQARLFIRNLELQDMAMRDDLTQLFNRRYFYDRLQRELDQARHLQRPLAVAVLDVDGLKTTNDSYGHQAGDLVLAAVGRLLVEHTRACDVPARIGGDEFAVIMPETDKTGAFAVARRLEEAVNSTTIVEVSGAHLRLNVSMGISGFPWGGDDVDAMVQWADTHMYAAKTTHHRGNGGPRQCCVQRATSHDEG